MEKVELVSVHGGHSGQFCHHAKDSLEEIVGEYVRKGYSWVGITEHAPGISANLLYPDQKAAGLTPEFLWQRFGSYMTECRRLQEKYRQQITIIPAMEIETYSGYEEFVPLLVKEFSPDYLVGSVHFVDDHGFDYSREQYLAAASMAGGIDQLYLRYFDIQYEMIKLIKPAVVGHFDLIRIFDQDYKTRLAKPDITRKIIRNLELIKELDLIMDFNLRSLLKGADEPYISRSILLMAREMGIAVVPGDDSHGLANVGLNMEKGIRILQETGFSTDWKCPV
ncbi:MAG: histidinol phosphatase [Deltaproteobacteria bacterium]|nr:MAG: histidinol phosphatase [Deltaproteobacteria bacterium]